MTDGGVHDRATVPAARVRAGAAFGALASGVFLSGVMLDSFANRSPATTTIILLFIASAIAAALALIAPRKPAAVLLLLGIVAFGVGWGLQRLSSPECPHLRSVVARLTVLETPKPSASGGVTCLAQLREVIEGWPEAPRDRRVWLSLPPGVPLPKPGDRKVVLADFTPVSPPANPGEFNLQRWAADRAIVGTLRVHAAPQLRPDESRPSSFEQVANAWRRGLAQLRSRASQAVDQLGTGATPEGRELLRGLLLGENPQAQGLSPFYQLGLAHILSISGFHLAVFAGAALFALRLCGDLGRLEPVLIALAILLFLAIVPPSSPLVRAAAILLTLLFTEFCGRRFDRLTLLAWVACAVLLVRPSELWSLGFQLSFGLTAALLGLGGRLFRRLFPPPLGLGAAHPSLAGRVSAGVGALFATSLLCWGISAPWIASVIGVLNPLAVVTTMLLTPLIVFVLWIGYALLLLGLLWPPLASVGAAPMTKLLALSIHGASWFDSFAIASVPVPPLSRLWAFAATLLLVYWFSTTRLRNKPFLAGAAALLLWAAGEWVVTHRLPANALARVHSLALRSASCVIIQTHEGTCMITTPSQQRARELATIARALGVWQLDKLVLDPARLEDSAGASVLLRTLRPRLLVLVPGGEPSVRTSIALEASQWGASIEESDSTAKALSEFPHACRELAFAQPPPLCTTVLLPEPAR